MALLIDTHTTSPAPAFDRLTRSAIASAWISMGRPMGRRGDAHVEAEGNIDALVARYAC